MMLRYMCITFLILSGQVLAQDSNSNGYNRRMSEEERDKILKDMEDSFSESDVACIVDPNPTQDPLPFPPVPSSFITDIEFSIIKDGLLTKKRVINGKEMYHAGLKSGIVQYELGEGIINSRPYDNEETVHYNVEKDEALDVTGNMGCTDEGSEDCHPRLRCQAMKIEEASYKLQELFGFVNTGSESGFMGASGILEFGPAFNYVHKSNQDCRGMQCQKFHTCLADPEENATVSINYYWSDPNWSMEARDVQVPVAVEVYATGKYGGVFTKKVMHRYDFYDFMFNAEPNEDILSPPANVYCHNRNVSYQPPELPSTFSYESETVTSFEINSADGNLTSKIDFDTVFPQTEQYDWEKKLASIKYVPFGVTGEERRHDATTIRIQDFIQGLSFDIKPHLQECNISIIENITSINDISVGENGSVSMVNPWVFMHMDEPMQFAGEHFIRGQSVDAWVGQKRSIIPFLNETYVMYYASSTFDDSLKKKTDLRSKSKDIHPVRMERHLAIGNRPHTIINMYSFTSKPPLTHTFDVSMCMTPQEMKNFIIKLPKDSIDKVQNEREKLKYAAQETLAMVANISALRINRLELEENKGLNLLFTVLESPSLVGDSESSSSEADMSEAVNNIRNALNSGQIIITVSLESSDDNGEPTVVSVIPQPKSMKEVNRNGNNYWFESPKQYNSGDMAGIAIGMILTGAIIGVVVNIAMRKKSGVRKFGDIFNLQFSTKRNEPEESEI